MKFFAKLVLAAAAVAGAAAAADAQIDARMFRYPDVSATQICFVYAGDIWGRTQGRRAGDAPSMPPGQEVFPRFSPMGAGSPTARTTTATRMSTSLPSSGGVPAADLSPYADRFVDWYPDGQRCSSRVRESGQQRFDQLFKCRRRGDAGEAPVPYGEFGLSPPTGKTLAYMPHSQDFRTWKRYRGGRTAGHLYLRPEDPTASNVTQEHASDESSPCGTAKSSTSCPIGRPTREHLGIDLATREPCDRSPTSRTSISRSRPSAPRRSSSR